MSGIFIVGAVVVVASLLLLYFPERRIQYVVYALVAYVSVAGGVLLDHRFKTDCYPLYTIGIFLLLRYGGWWIWYRASANKDQRKG